jgi:hypothetical protein
MIGRTDYRTLIDRGRKAGLGTADLYRALGAQRPEASDVLTERADSNGYVAGYGHNGKRVYRPIANRFGP